jgi:hypothetical protein
MKAAFEEATTVAFIGVIHIQGVRILFLEEGYEVTQEEA